MQTDHHRRELYLALQGLLGPGPADTLMELLPPAGWSDLVRKSDLEGGLASVRGEIAEVRGEIAELRGEVQAGLASVRGEMAGFRGEIAELRGVIAAQVPRFVLATVPLILGTAGLVLAATKLA